MKLSKIQSHIKGGFTLIELMVVICILAVLGSVAYPTIIDHMKDGDRAKARENLSSLYKSLTAFRQNQGAYPCDTTAANISESLGDLYYGELTGDSSNPYFRQLIATGNKSEKPFFASISCAGKILKEEGDNKVANGKALERGENAFAYVVRSGEEGKSPVTNNEAPLALCSIYPSNKPYTGDNLVFDNSTLGSHVFILLGNGAVQDVELEEDDNDEEKGIIKDEKKRDIFPETKKGASTANRYLVLPPEL